MTLEVSNISDLASCRENSPMPVLVSGTGLTRMTVGCRASIAGSPTLPQYQGGRTTDGRMTEGQGLAGQEGRAGPAEVVHHVGLEPAAPCV